VPIFASGVCVALDITDKLGINLCGGVETEAGLDLLVLQIAVDSLGTADDLNAIIVGSIILCQHAGIGIGVVSTDDDQGLDVELLQNLAALLKLVGFFQLGTARSDHVKTTGIAVLVNIFGSKLNVFVIDQSARTHEESVNLVVGVLTLHSIENTANHIVSARSLTAGKNDTHILLHANLLITRHKLYDRHAVCVREQTLDFILITNTLCQFTFFYLYSSYQTLGKFRLILQTSFLQ